jgi:glucokinase-like ROK family protein
VLALIRSGECRTRPQLATATGLGRNIITQRVAELIGHGLVVDGVLGPSTGGRAPRELSFRADAGQILAVALGASGLSVGIADLDGSVRARRTEPADVGAGPEVVLGRVEELLLELRAEVPGDVWGIGIGIPGPVEFSTGRPIAPPIMPGWDGFDVRGYFNARHHVPVWVDNDANVMGLGELRNGAGRGASDLLYIKVGTGIGAGLISNGRLHRGAQGCAGDIGHIEIDRPDGDSVLCRCGNLNCLEAFAGGAAIARDATVAAVAGRSPRLATVLTTSGALQAADVAWAAGHGDHVSVELLARSARLLGENIARMVNFFNPAVIVIGGGVANSGDSYLANVKQIVIKRSLPLATRSLHIVRSSLGPEAGLIGAAFMVADELFSQELLGDWIHDHPATLDQATR